MFVLNKEGAGQEVGKSCVVVTINGKRIMFDCGMHMGYDDHRRYPDFSLISKSRDFDHSLDCVIITHLYTKSYLIPLLIAFFFRVNFLWLNAVIWIMLVLFLTSLKSVVIMDLFT